ncbi:MAG: dienelactone hydrolase family protein [Chloroflexi bacterium]|jgi:dienelactone hydrolase|nr:dienelactone hydrolase family protein [Chloroflexota bacterium]MCU0483178.1 dienelactone hydrolase family protein [Chloroflexota bacterium]
MGVVRTRIPAPAGKVAAVRALPAIGPARGVLLAHDAWGLDEEAVTLAAALAELGFSVLAPDLAGGRRAGDPAEAAAMAAGLDAEEAMLVLAAAVDVLAADPATRPGAIGVVGVGMGAPLGAFLATLRPEIGIVVTVDGPLPELPVETWSRSDASFVVLAGADDGPGDDPGGGLGQAGAPDGGVADPEAGLDALRAAGLAVRVVRWAEPPGEVPAAAGDAIAPRPSLAALVAAVLSAALGDGGGHGGGDGGGHGGRRTR